jgi:hypothetical protein
MENKRSLIKGTLPRERERERNITATSERDKKEK